MTPSPLLTCRDITKVYARRNAVGPMTFSHGPGVVTVTGPNGAGKSTLLSILAGITQPDTGTVQICGFDLAESPVAARRNLAFIADEAVGYDFMSGLDFVDFLLCFRGKKRTAEADKLIDELGLLHQIDKRLDQLSFGTKKKIFILSALIATPPVVIMDEPTNGIDSDARDVLIRTINLLKADRLFIISTHDEAFADAIVDTRITLPAS